MTPDKQSVTEIIGSIKDNDLDKSLNELGAIKDVIVEGSAIQVRIELVQPIFNAYKQVKVEIIGRLSEKYPDYRIETLIDEENFTPRGKNYLKDVKNIIAVASGKGGVGKSSIASNIAAGLSLTGARVGILDGDVYGPSQPTMFGMTDGRLTAYTGADGKPVAAPAEQYGIKVASMGFVINRDEAAIVRGPMLAGYFSMLFEQVDWGALDFLVFDLPPGTGDIQLTLTQKIPLTGAVIVTTPQEISLADVRRSITMFQRVKVDILGIVENMSYFEPEDMPGKRYYIFGKGGGSSIASDYSVPLLGEVPLNIKMREDNDNGKPIVLNSDSGNQGAAIKSIVSNLIKEVRVKNYQDRDNSGVNISI